MEHNRIWTRAVIATTPALRQARLVRPSRFGTSSRWTTAAPPRPAPTHSTSNHPGSTESPSHRSICSEQPRQIGYLFEESFCSASPYSRRRSGLRRTPPPSVEQKGYQPKDEDYWRQDGEYQGRPQIASCEQDHHAGRNQCHGYQAEHPAGLRMFVESVWA